MSDSSQVQNNGENYGIKKVPQPHGGALNSGGTPGNKGGGNYRTTFRDGLQKLGASKGLKVVEKALDDENPTVNMKAVEVIIKGGFGEAKAVMEEEFFNALMDVAYKMFPQPEASKLVEAVLERLKESAG